MIRYTDKYIEQLLLKFMNGESTLEEEAQLGDYFRTQDIKPEWEAYRAMFAYFDNGMKEADVADEPKKHGNLLRQIGIAACIALICGMAVVFFHINGTSTEMARTEKTETIKVEKVNVLPDKTMENVGSETVRIAKTATTAKAAKAKTNKRRAKRNVVGRNDVADKDVKQAKEELRVTQEEIAMAYYEIAAAFNETEETNLEIQAALVETRQELGSMNDNDIRQTSNNIKTLIMQ